MSERRVWRDVIRRGRARPDAPEVRPYLRLRRSWGSLSRDDGGDYGFAQSIFRLIGRGRIGRRQHAEGVAGASVVHDFSRPTHGASRQRSLDRKTSRVPFDAALVGRVALTKVVDYAVHIAPARRISLESDHGYQFRMRG
jgi:hypothetical protein